MANSLKLISLEMLRNRETDYLFRTTCIVQKSRKSGVFNNYIELIDKLDTQRGQLENFMIFNIRGDKSATAAKAKLREEMDAGLRYFADVVELVAKGNEDIARGSGFPLLSDRHDHNKHYTNEPPLGLDAENYKRAGAIFIGFQACAGVEGYEIAWEEAGTGILNKGNFVKPSARPHLDLEGLKQGMKILIYVRCLGPHNQKSDWSSGIELFVS